MADRYIERTLGPVVRRAVREFPAVVLTGPRQSGKTTLLKHIFGSSYRYVSLEPPDVRMAAAQDPRGFLEMYPPPVIFDEVQYAPDLLPYIKERIDERRGRCGQYLITGSQNLLLMERVTESLAGRAAMLRLLPLTRREAEGQPQKPLPWEKRRPRHRSKAMSPMELWKELLRGSYPELATHPKRDVALWHSAYIQTYLERDIRTLRQVGDLTQFQNFLRLLAARSAQLLHLSDISRNLGIAVNTAKSWLSVLEATYQIIVLRPYFANVGKRLVKAPKVYFTDVGTLCYLAGLRDAEHAAAGPMGGAIFETAVVSEIFKTLMHQGIEPQIYFWRTSAGAEVDIMVEFDHGLVPVEVKLSSTPRPTMALNIKTFQKDFGDKVTHGYVLHPGNIRLPLGSGVTALPFADM
ncbi:MAG TPA: ATP-binding protein [Thermodesulfovibrionales bacterium]|nr:ATP-binding protein [Thermodesulfovibrionales bacterium]